MPKVVFLILNYNSLHDLILCEESIAKNCANYHIVVVDNGSKQVEVDELEAFCDEKKASVTLIKSSQNLGFARGNNLGFRYIREHIQCKYIAMINSDTLIVDRTFCAKIDEAFNKYHFAVLGPDVLPAHSNPMVDEPDSKEKVLQQIAKTKKQIKIIKTPGVNILYLCMNRLKRKFAIKRAALISEPVLDCELHGCFLVFSNLYTLDGLNEETFLYGEEDLLAKACRDNNLTLLYYPQLKIIHNESVATKKSMPNLIKRKLFFLVNRLDSYYVLLKEYENEGYGKIPFANKDRTGMGLKDDCK